MSIYGSAGFSVGFNFDDHDYSDDRGKVRAYPNGFSNSYPEHGPAEMYRAGISGTGICAWCVPGQRDSHEDDFDRVGPWLRIEVAVPKAPNYWRKTEDGDPTYEAQHALVLLDEAAVRSLRDDLTAWLDRPKVHPANEADR